MVVLNMFSWLFLLLAEIVLHAHLSGEHFCLKSFFQKYSCVGGLTLKPPVTIQV